MAFIEIPAMHLRVDTNPEPWEGEGALWLLNLADEAEAAPWVRRVGSFRRVSSQDPRWIGGGAFPYRIRDEFSGRVETPAELLAWGNTYRVSTRAIGAGRPPAIVGEMQLDVSLVGDAVGEQLIALAGIGDPPSQLLEGGMSLPTSFPREDRQGGDRDPGSPIDVVARTDSMSIRIASIAVVERVAKDMLASEREDPWVRGFARGLLSDMAVLRDYLVPGGREGAARAALNRLTEVYREMNPLLQKGVDYGVMLALRGVLHAFGINVP